MLQFGHLTCGEVIHSCHDGVRPSTVAGEDQLMSFEDLPQNWTDMPLSTPGLAVDVVDLVLKESDRAQRAMLLLPCDEHDVGYPTPIVIPDTDWFVGHDERREMLAALASLGLPSVVAAVSAPQRLPAEVVERWHTDFHAALTAANTRLIGFFTAWPNTVEQVHGASVAR